VTIEGDLLESFKTGAASGPSVGDEGLVAQAKGEQPIFINKSELYILKINNLSGGVIPYFNLYFAFFEI